MSKDCLTKGVLVTGANGFVGSHLVPFLIKEGWRVKAAVRNKKQFDLLPPNAVPVEVGEIHACTDWTSAVNGVEAVVHLAGLASSKNSEFSTERYFQVNVDGTVNLAKQAIACGVQHFIFMSSIHAVAFLSEDPITETSPCRPHSIYSQSKLQAEKAFIEAASGSNMDWTILRPAPIYGVGHRGNLHRLIQLVQTGLPLLVGSVRNQRSVLFIGNLLDLVSRVLGNPKAFGQIFLVADTEIVSTPELIRSICTVLSRGCALISLSPVFLKWAGLVGDMINKITRLPVPLNSSLVNGFLGSLYCQCAHVRDRLNWMPPFSLLEGLNRTIRVTDTELAEPQSFVENVPKLKRTT